MITPDFSSERVERVFRIAVGVFAAVALLYLLTEERSHLIEWLPHLVLLACPLIYVLMHHGHGRRGRR